MLTTTKSSNPLTSEPVAMEKTYVVQRCSLFSSKISCKRGKYRASFKIPDLVIWRTNTVRAKCCPQMLATVTEVKGCYARVPEIGTRP